MWYFQADNLGGYKKSRGKFQNHSWNLAAPNLRVHTPMHPYDLNFKNKIVPKEKSGYSNPPEKIPHQPDAIKFGFTKFTGAYIDAPLHFKFKICTK